jgi:CubicO group peptidase (beta-lactamase class C family)
MKTRLEMILLLVLMTGVVELLAQQGSTPGPGVQLPAQPLLSAIYQAMTSNDVQGLSVAVMTNGSIAWAKGFGRLAKGRPELVDTNTLFQAASITKPTTALAALKMVDQGLLSLDEPINNKLKTLLIPGKNATNVTLRRILSHTGGLNSFGDPGYVVGSKLPTLVQILKGEPPANTPAVMASGPVGVWDYSNGGYIFLQALLTDVSRQEFPDLLRSTVLEPLGMSRSTFEQPLPDKLQGNAASGHVGGAVIEGNWHVYPELGAGGMWTTASDLARMFIAIRSAYLGGPEALIEQTTAQQMLTSQAIGAWGPWGLGLSLKLEQGKTVSFQHAGVNKGFRAGIIMILKTGDGVAIMTNSETSIENTIYNACATVYGWPQTLPDCCF